MLSVQFNGGDNVALVITLKDDGSEGITIDGKMTIRAIRKGGRLRLSFDGPLEMKVVRQVGIKKKTNGEGL